MFLQVSAGLLILLLDGTLSLLAGLFLTLHCSHTALLIFCV
jgi:hypothetical protein